MFLKNLFKGHLIKRLIKNSAILLSGNLLASLFGLISIALTARALGPETFGIIVLINTYVKIIDKLVNFQSWRALIKFGTDALEKNDHDDFIGLIKFGFIVDVSSAILGTSIGVLGVYFVGLWKEWDNGLIIIAALYCLIIMFRLSGTPTAILRIFDKFKIFAVRSVVAAILKVVCVATAFLLGKGFVVFIAIWAFVDIFGQLLLLHAGWQELKRQKITGISGHNIKKTNQKYPEFLKYIWATNIDSSISIGRELDVFIIGSVLSLEAVGLYKIAQQIGSVFMRVIDPMYAAIYPELSKLIASGNVMEFVRLMKRSSIILGFIMLLPFCVFIIWGDQLIILFFGVKYHYTYLPAIYFISAMIVWAFAQPLAPGILSLGKPQVNLIIHLVTTIIYIFLLYFLTKYFNITGAGIAYLLFYIIWSISMFVALFLIIRAFPKN